MSSMGTIGDRILLHFKLRELLLVSLIIFTPIVMQSKAVWAADPLLERGQKLFKKCVHCHTYQKGQNHRIGPNLHGMFGRKAGAIADYEYSDAWKNANFVWSGATLDTYLKSPRNMIPGNRMPFDGLSRPADRRALIAYMRTIVSEQE
jgi:cytochrome c